ncbi:DUF554 family protein [Anaerocolumna sedimenticola]|uniref:DUF554 family protein n=1 Tax=Anaerocolumna sedimenticola TaxID=2696063 RepID=A0A6P1TJC2_9FIRM|nr:DUF554 domain-containing protein [Anaerocolumna sedimenticola]QHQ60219.1 DUF554 family protein [Anaerocolumna sedimenticola]
MIGVLINGAAVLFGGFIGLLFKKGIPESIEKSMNKALGLVVIIIGINGVISNMFRTQADGSLLSSGELLLVISFTIGTLAGEILKLDDKINAFSGKIEHKFKIQGFTAGFITASSICCIGAMGIIGSLTSGLTGDNSILITKSILDLVITIVLAASLGFGVMFSCIPLVIYQGSICLFAGFLSNILVGELLTQVCMVGFTLIICVGLNLMTDIKFKTVNMLPSLLIPVIYYGIRMLF